jgi:succinoglycan biosynthesis transport protein ExoP
MPNLARPEGERGEDKLHFLDYWRVVKKRKEIIIATLVIIVFSVAVLSWITTPTYSAYSRIKVEQRQRPMDVFQPERASLLFDPYEYETHRESLSSYPVLERVVLGEIYTDQYQYTCPKHPQVVLADDEARQHNYSCPVCGERLKRQRPKKYPNWVPLNKKWADEEGSPAPYSMPRAVAILNRNLRIRPEKGTKIITIRYDSNNRKPDEAKKEAMMIANMVAEAYRQWQTDKNWSNLQTALAELDLRQFEAREEQKNRVAALTEMKKKFALDKQDQPIQYLRLEQNLTEKGQVGAQVAKAKAYVDLLSAMTIEERVNATQDHPGVYQWSVKLGEDEAALDALLEEYGIEHPLIKSQKKRIANERETLDALVNGVLESKKADLQSLQEQEKELDKIISRLEKEISESRDAMVEYETAKEEVELNRTILLQMEQAKTTEAITNALPRQDIQIVQYAELPQSPVKPKKLFNIIVSIFVGLTLGTGLAYFVDYVDTSIKNVDDLERYLGMSTLAVIPQQKDTLLINENPKSHAAENYRTLWTSMEFERREDKFKNIMITSGGVGEGKTTTVVNLGIAAAQMDAKVLLVDSDLRRPKIHKLLKYPNSRGLSDVLLNDVNPRDVIIQTDIPGMSVLPSGKLPSNVIGLLSSQKMRNVVETLSEDYDIVLYDSPPVIGVSDASLLANVVNRVLLVIDYRKYPKRFANRARRMLENVGGKVMGVIINNMRVTEEDYYYYGYGRAYRYYYRRYEDKEDTDEAKGPGASPPKGAVEAPSQQDTTA